MPASWTSPPTPSTTSAPAAPVVPLLFGIDQASELLGVSIKTIYREVSQGRLPCVRFGPNGYGKLRFNHAHLAEYVRRATTADGVFTPDPRSWPP